MKGVVVGIAGAVVALVFACGSDDRSGFADPGAGNPTFTEGGLGNNPDLPDADLYAKDPPPQWCGPGGDPAPPAPGGTEACPDDKNKPGCPCDKAGDTKPCWTGLRKHRGLGICKDGTTTCRPITETSLEWGECVGEVLPKTGATKGKDACGCFSEGQWKIANTVPCVMIYGSSPAQYNVVSTIPHSGGDSTCPTQNPPSAAPTEDWSTDTLKVDCAGHFRLCFRLRQGVFETPSPNDCILTELCTEADYKQPNVEQPWPNLPGWLAADKACAEKWGKVPNTQSPGYYEMVVKGKSVRCDAIDDGAGNPFVFSRVKYCPLSCNDNPTTDECKACQAAGSGKF